MRMIVQMSGLFSIGLNMPAAEPDTFNSNCQDLANHIDEFVTEFSGRQTATNEAQ